jgi:threonine synthase
MSYKGLIDRYKKYLPVTDKTPIVSFCEGNTPLLRADNLSAKLGLNVFLKYDGMNPTGSFKDRGMTMAISKAKEKGFKAVACASTGNTSASAAAYSAKAGLDCIVIIPGGKIALGKLAQAISYGASIYAIDGNFDKALEMVRLLCDKYPVELVNSVNPFRIEGQKTAAFEVCDNLGDAPDHLCIPVGNAGNITAYWKGFNEYRSEKKISKLPKMLGFQAEGSAPIVKGHPIEKPETIATAIRIGNPASWKSAVAAAQESGGSIRAVSDDEIVSAYKLVASAEGIFCEPASAASIAGLLKYGSEIPKGSNVVCVLTGHGLKDPDTAVKNGARPVELNKFEEIIKHLGY